MKAPFADRTPFERAQALIDLAAGVRQSGGHL